MSYLVDTNVFVYAVAEVPFRDACRAVLEHAAAGGGRTSTGVLEEIWHLELRGRPLGLDGLAARTYRAFAPLLPVTDAIVRRAVALPDSSLGANDRIHVATCLEHDIGSIVTVDDDFDGVRGLRRVDPRDGRALKRLLNG